MGFRRFLKGDFAAPIIGATKEIPVVGEFAARGLGALRAKELRKERERAERKRNGGGVPAPPTVASPGLPPITVNVPAPETVSQPQQMAPPFLGGMGPLVILGGLAAVLFLVRK